MSRDLTPPAQRLTRSLSLVEDARRHLTVAAPDLKQVRALLSIARRELAEVLSLVESQQ
jgi:hypothetical protein